MKWLGHCPRCGQWDTFEEQKGDASHTARVSSWIGEELKPINAIDLKDVSRLSSGLGEVDRLLGGGLVPGGVILFGGEPGVGKSTLLLQISDNLCDRYGKVLYVSGEESAAQIKLRASRLGIDNQNLYVLSEQSLTRISEAIAEVAPLVLVVDSIQTVVSNDAPGEAGSLKQLKEASAELTRLTKARKMATFLVGHITKGGSFAGPKMIEHLVDVAIYLEGGAAEETRILRSVKNRFGSTNEIAVFRMASEGLKEVSNPSRFFLEEHKSEPRAGTAIAPLVEGTRPILVEIQALVSPTGGYGVPQRRCTGLDFNRVLLLLAVIDRRLGISVGSADVYLSLAGGLESRERAVDLGVIAAVVSSLRDRALPGKTALVGEVGLSGEIRRVKKLQERVAETGKLGYERILVPGGSKGPYGGGIEVIHAETIEEAMEILMLR